ncbi:hypothetical protein IFR05_001430 [Cadophora sp. M221]|nr:hypothetical protein IFR05_001430 [Cadophora sp. M221]
MPSWRLPKIQAVLRGSEDDEDSTKDPRPDELRGEDDEFTDDESGNAELKAKQEKTFYSEASERLSHIVSQVDISQLKRRYLHSHVVGYNDKDLDEAAHRQFGQYFSDSENESGSKRDPPADDMSDEEDW